MADDSVLIDATMRGEAEAFGVLARKYHRALVTSACHLLRCAEDAEDLAQEALLTAYQRLGQLRDRDKFRAWLFAILRQKCVEYLRTHRPTFLSLQDCAEIPATPMDVSDDELHDLLNRLPFADREVLSARYLAELEYEEIASALGCSVPTAYVRCKRARERLRTLMRQGDEEDTRRTMQRAMSALTAGLLSDAFVKRVLQEVKPMEMTFTNPSVPAEPPIGILPTASVRLPVAGWKIAAGLAVVGALVGFLLTHRWLAIPTAAVQPTPIVQPLLAASPLEQSNTRHGASHLCDTPQLPLMWHGASSPCRTPQHPLLLAAATPPTVPVAAPLAAPIKLPPVVYTAPAATPPKMVLQLGNSGLLSWMALSPDGQRLVTTDYLNTAILWDLRDGTILERIPNIVTEQVQFSADNRRLLFNGDKNSPPVVWDIAAGQAVPTAKSVAGLGRFTTEGKYWEYQTPYKYGPGHTLSYSDSTHGLLLAYLTIENPGQENFLTMPATLNLRDPVSGNIERTVPGISGQLLDISRDNRKAVTLTGTPSIVGKEMTDVDHAEFIVWDLTTGKEITRLKGLSGSHVEPNAVRFSPDGRQFAAASCTGDAPSDLRIWDTSTGVLVHTLNTPTAGEHRETPPPHTRYIDILAFSADGTLLASGGLDGQAVVWDVAGGHRLKTFRTAEHQVEELAFTPDGAYLLTGSETTASRSSIQCWDVQTGQQVRQYAGPLRRTTLPGFMSPFAATPDGKQVAVCDSKSINLWDLSTGCVHKQLPLPGGRYPITMAFNPDGTMLMAILWACSGNDSGASFTVWDLPSGVMKKWMPAEITYLNQDTTFRVAFSPDGAYALGCDESALYLWNTKDWSEVKRFGKNPLLMSDAAFSPDSKKLAWFGTHYGENDSRESQLAIWDILADRSDTLSSEQGLAFADLAFSPDGKWLATRMGKAIRLWNLAEGKAGKSITAELLPRYSLHARLSFTADSTHLLCMGLQQLFYCDIATGEVKSIALSDISRSQSITLTRDGRQLLTCEVDGTVRCWDTAEVIAQHTMQPRATLQTFEDNRWLITTPTGYFDCTPEVLKAICWKQGEQHYPCAEFEQEYHQPDLVRKALQE